MKERKGILVGGIQIKAQALKFANEMQIENLGLKFSDGWMRHFKKGKDCDSSYFFFLKIKEVFYNFMSFKIPTLLRSALKF